MTLNETIRYPGQGRVSTLNGTIALEESAGRLIIRDGASGNPRNIQDVDGTHLYDTAGRLMTELNTLGLTTIEPATQRHRNRYGIALVDGRSGDWISKPGTDVRTLLNEPLDT